MQDASLAQECGIALQAQTEIPAEKMRCLEEKMRQSFSRPMVKGTVKPKERISNTPSATPAASSGVEKGN